MEENKSFERFQALCQRIHPDIDKVNTAITKAEELLTNGKLYFKFYAPIMKDEDGISYSMGWERLENQERFRIIMKIESDNNLIIKHFHECKLEIRHRFHFFIPRFVELYTEYLEKKIAPLMED